MPDQFRIGGGEAGGHSNSTTTHKYYGLSAVASFATGDDENDESATNRDQTKGVHIPLMNAQKGHPPHHPTRLSYGEHDSPFRVIRPSRTWDHHGDSPLRQPVDLHSMNDIAKHCDGNLRQTSSFDPWSSPVAGRSWKGRVVQPLGNVDSGPVAEPFRIASGERQCDHEKECENETKDWKKIEVERGKAVGLLSSIVKQSLDFDGKMDGFSGDEEYCSESSSLGDMDNLSHDCLEKMKLVASAVKEISADSSDNGDESLIFNHQVRSSAIDKLLSSYELALKVKQSSLVANEWLQSIGSTKDNNHSSSSSEESKLSMSQSLSAKLHLAENTISDKQDEISRLKEEIGRLKSSSTRAQPQRQPSSMLMNQSILSDSSSDESFDDSKERNGPLVLCSPPAVQLGVSHDESFAKWEKGIDISMNLESRKEILLLKAQLLAANRKISACEQQQELKGKEPFSSEIEPIKAMSDDGNSEQLFMRIAEDIESEAVDDTFASEDEERDGSMEDTGPHPTITLGDPALEKELEEYRAALITSLRAEEGGKSARADSITSSEDANFAQNLSKSDSDQKMVNVRMIDGENFTTEWGDLAPALPPPPDHELHSPIVDAILSKWTDDLNTRSALITWIENILKGSNTEPSLKLSGLDHQIRDGFVMHVLPLLLRRKDVHVHLTTRAHRQTTYDIAVSVRQSVVLTYERASDTGSEDPDIHQRQISQDSKHHLMAFQATRSGAAIKDNANADMSPAKQMPSLTKPFLGRNMPDLVRSSSYAGSISTASAVTSPISNQTPARRPLLQGRSSYTTLSSERKKGHALAQDSLGDFLDDTSVGSSEDDDNDSKQSHRQSSIMGRAFGLLSRRKPSHVESQLSSTKHGIHDGTFETPKRNANHPSSKSFKEEDHSYHRVVSAPPGKIGITFVEYRGHAMVSHVSEESPLVSYVFEADVLIAIDDVPVSGLRTRDIVKLLTNKVGQQRNLRMVSAVAMDELTRHG